MNANTQPLTFVGAVLAFLGVALGMRSAPSPKHAEGSAQTEDIGSSCRSTSSIGEAWQPLSA